MGVYHFLLKYALPLHPAPYRATVLGSRAIMILSCIIFSGGSHHRSCVGRDVETAVATIVLKCLELLSIRLIV